MYKRKASPLIGPSMNHRAVIRSWRKAAMLDPSGSRLSIALGIPPQLRSAPGRVFRYCGSRERRTTSPPFLRTTRPQLDVKAAAKGYAKYAAAAFLRGG
jgi:hypothetical protein